MSSTTNQSGQRKAEPGRHSPRHVVFMGAIAIALTTIAANTLWADEKNADDESAVRAAVESYFEGARTGTAGPFEKAWDLETGRMVYVRERDGVEALHSVPIREAIKHWTAGPPGESWGKIQSIDMIDGKMAIANVEMLFHGTIYLDLLSLYKVDGTWKIVNKTFVRRAKAE